VVTTTPIVETSPSTDTVTAVRYGNKGPVKEKQPPEETYRIAITTEPTLSTEMATAVQSRKKSPIKGKQPPVDIDPSLIAGISPVVTATPIVDTTPSTETVTVVQSGQMGPVKGKQPSEETNQPYGDPITNWVHKRPQKWTKVKNHVEVEKPKEKQKNLEKPRNLDKQKKLKKRNYT